MKNYRQNCWKYREKLEKINHEIKKHEIIERSNIKEKSQKYFMKQRHLKTYQQIKKIQDSNDEKQVLEGH